MNNIYIKYFTTINKDIQCNDIFFHNNAVSHIVDDSEVLITLFGLSPNGLHKRKEKYHFFFQTTRNIFLTELHKKQFINIFCKIQKLYFAFNRMIYMYKYRKSTIIVNTDLSLTPICENGPDVICIFQNNHRYLFNVKDLIKIINNSLSNSCNFFVEPLICKNPYNNMSFNKSTLYNIYFYVRNYTKVYPEILHAFFLTNFDIYNLILQYSYLLREYTLNHYITNTSLKNLYYDIMDMIEEYNTNKKRNPITIHDDFPKKELLDIMKPYLMLYLKSRYSLIENIKIEAELLLEKKLIRFYYFNPEFGRKKIVSTYVLKNDKIVQEFSQEFNKKHVGFYKKNDDFMNSHIIV